MDVLVDFPWLSGRDFEFLITLRDGLELPPDVIETIQKQQI
jgi:hypothetical protein